MAATCRSCGADIIWVVNTNGKKVPLDEKPITGPVYDIRGTFDGTQIAAPVAIDPPGRPLFRSHFETCPDAKDWSK